ncbi:hypothetical protein SORBI_3009G125700 [Sorghum bicolor]|jgi:hypothetical protein|uniref:Uncharacterized protein n=1 Tax=Sorghum bicolor TaxID=4558 RepID=A0A1Z5R3I7_SORBI|nr:hypothetical protein SORBI_3009G125700 [Sorghum bicolor]
MEESSMDLLIAAYSEVTSDSEIMPDSEMKLPDSVVASDSEITLLDFVVALDSVVAPDTIVPESIEDVPDSVEDVPDSVDDISDSVDHVIAGSDEVPDSVIALDSVAAPDTVVPESVEDVQDSVEDFPDSVNDISDSVDHVIAGSDEVPDSVKEVQCPRCGTFHAGGVFGEACFQARRNARRCARCGLLHADYDVPARFLYGVDKFDCEFFIPDVEKLEMHGNTIILPDEVVKKLEDTKFSKVHSRIRNLHLLIFIN